MMERSEHVTEVGGAKEFSSIYGTKREEVVELVGKDQALRLTLEHIKKYPGVYVDNLRKAKARYMVEALRNGVYEGGNHFITCYGYVYHFFYRGTVVYRWDAITDHGFAVDAKEYEHTASTHNQRKEIQKAIENFKESVLKA